MAKIPAIDPEICALQALAFLVASEEHRANFLEATGASPDDLGDMIHNPAALGAVLDYVLQSDAVLLAVAESLSIAPAAIVASRQRLPGWSA
ncbi:MAG TPA: DUF3572 family protein [Dongiaceae bacterium]|nr:DUF3572 family protein [Dongiaceae bacterium]